MEEDDVLTDGLGRKWRVRRSYKAKSIKYAGNYDVELEPLESNSMPEIKKGDVIVQMQGYEGIEYIADEHGYFPNRDIEEIWRAQPQLENAFLSYYSIDEEFRTYKLIWRRK